MRPERQYAQVVAEQQDCRGTDTGDVQPEQRSHGRGPVVESGLPPDEAAGPEYCLDDRARVAQGADHGQGRQQCLRDVTPRNPFPPTRKMPHGPFLPKSSRVTCYANVTCWTIAAAWPVWTPPDGVLMAAVGACQPAAAWPVRALDAPPHA